ncbi:MAG: TolC family protein [Longimicrobiales bacterium]|nr:TolC family protein [Longimicrobiales bacterium]
MRFAPPTIHAARRGRLFRHRAGWCLVGTVLFGLIAADAGVLHAQESAAPPVLTLDEVIERALVTDPAAVQAATSVSLAEANQLQARGTLLPTVNSSFTFANSSNQRFDQTTGQLVSQNYSAQLQANYELFGGGRRLLQMRSAGAGMDAAQAGLRAQRFNTILNATATYFAAAAADDLLRAAEGRLERARQQLVFAETRLEVGNATSSDVLRAELEVSNSELAVLQARTSLEANRLQLGRLAGLEGEVSPSADALPDRAPALPDEDILVARALRSSPEVVAARAQVNAASADRLGAWTGYIPSVRFIGGYDWFAFQFPPDRRSWAFRLVASLPLFNGFQRETGIMRVNAQLRAAEARAADADRAVRTLLRTAYRAVRTREREVEIADRGVALAREDLRVQEDRYQLGVANIVDLQTSQLALADAEAAAVVARQALGTALAELEAILGETLTS